MAAVAQALVFAAGSVFGLRYSPYGFLYRHLVRKVKLLV